MTKIRKYLCDLLFNVLPFSLSMMFTQFIIFFLYLGDEFFNIPDFYCGNIPSF